MSNFSSYRHSILRHTGLIAMLLSPLVFSSCATRAPRLNYSELAQAAIRLDMDIAKDDNHLLYVETSKWIGVPHRLGGTNKRGIDCSGFTSRIYKDVYHIQLKRSSEEQRRYNCKKVPKKQLNEGDLVFFHDGKNKQRASHVGIYLKDGRFIHSSTSRGVIVDQLTDEYYQRHWLQGGKVK